MFVFVGAPYIKRLRGNHTLASALTGITAAVVGVITTWPSTSPSTPCSATSPPSPRPAAPAGARPHEPEARLTRNRGDRGRAAVPAEMVRALHPRPMRAPRTARGTASAVAN
ncbi:MAG: hypothetical protein ACR2K2_15425 [Mycobacteriales bacterium]